MTSTKTERRQCGWCGAYEGTVDPDAACDQAIDPATGDPMGPHQFPERRSGERREEDRGPKARMKPPYQPPRFTRGADRRTSAPVEVPSSREPGSSGMPASAGVASVGEERVRSVLARVGVTEATIGIATHRALVSDLLRASLSAHRPRVDTNPPREGHGYTLAMLHEMLTQRIVADNDQDARYWRDRLHEIAYYLDLDYLYKRIPDRPRVESHVTLTEGRYGGRPCVGESRVPLHIVDHVERARGLAAAKEDYPHVAHLIEPALRLYREHIRPRVEDAKLLPCPFSTLLPCPFCGAEAEVVVGDEIALAQCTRVKMHRIYADGDNNAIQEVADAWNQRAAFSEREPKAWVRVSANLKACPDCGDVTLEGFVECIECGCEPTDDISWRNASYDFRASQEPPGETLGWVVVAERNGRHHVATELEILHAYGGVSAPLALDWYRENRPGYTYTLARVIPETEEG